MNKIDLKELNLNDYPLKTYDKVRYADTDRQGHVNNAVFSTFLETGRVELLLHPNKPLLSSGGAFVIASLNLNLLSEIKWPGIVDIGTAVVKVGNSSIQLVQGLFQNGKLTATAETVIVQMDEETRRSKALSGDTKDILSCYLLDL